MKHIFTPVFILITSVMLLSCGLTNRFLGGKDNSLSDQEVVNETIATMEIEIEQEDTADDSIDDEEEELTISSIDVDACYHPFLPVIDGATWTFHDAMESDYTLTMSIIDENTFTMVQELHDDGTIFSVDWYCSEDGLLQGTFANVDFFDDSSDFEGMDLSFETLNWEGQTLPNPDLIEIGYTWTASYTLSSDFVMEGFTSEMIMQVTIDYVIAAIEEITVPAGTFSEAYRVDSASVIEMSFGDPPIPINVVDYTFSNWYVVDIGLVKTGMDGLGFTSDVELQESSLLY